MRRSFSITRGAKTPSVLWPAVLRPALLIRLAVLVVAAGATACNAASPLRGVGAPASSSASVAANAAEPAQSPLLSGTAMNMVPAPQAKADAYAPEEIPPPPEMALTREEAVRQIREKASQPTGKKPNVFATRDSKIPRMTAEEQENNALEMEAAAQRNAGKLGATGNPQSVSSTRSLELKAKSHYEDALENIEN
jgi:hypothetical protein